MLGTAVEYKRRMRSLKSQPEELLSRRNHHEIRSRHGQHSFVMYWEFAVYLR